MTRTTHEITAEIQERIDKLRTGASHEVETRLLNEIIALQKERVDLEGRSEAATLRRFTGDGGPL